jgi:hypothetical protein
MSFGQAIIDGLRAAGPREVLVRGSRRLTGQDVLAMVSGAARWKPAACGPATPSPS